MMRKTTLIIAFLGLAASVLGQPDIQLVTSPKSVGVYGLFEVSLSLGTYDNPYDPEVIDVYAVFQGPDGSRHRVTGFYYESFLLEKDSEKNYEKVSRDTRGDSWRIRFTPDVAGRWTYTIHAVDRKGEAKLDSYGGHPLMFDCQARDAEGFIRQANSKYLKREAYLDGKRNEHAFFPIGPNVGWYGAVDYHTYKKPYGIFEYQEYIDKLAGNANYMRVWLTRYQYLSLYGPEHALRNADGKPVVFFDSTVNQKDSEELDYIVRYAGEHGISLMLCFFTFGDFREDSEDLEKSEKYGGMPSGWRYNPFHTILGLKQPIEFFTNPQAIRITKNLIRYIVARWGYAPNLVCWELWNELGNIFLKEELDEEAQQAIIQWHETMKSWINSLDPNQHLVSTSLGNTKGKTSLEREVFNHLDIVQDHNYQNIQKAVSREQFSYVLYREAQKARQLYDQKPYFMGEFGFGQASKDPKLEEKDPFGVDVHNSLWSSAFSGSMGPASFWFWKYLKEKDLFGLFKPLLTFFDACPLLSDSFQAMTTGKVSGRELLFPNHLETYYMINASEDTLMGWSQDTAFCYQSLRHLTDAKGSNGHFVVGSVNDPKGYVYTMNPSKRPQPSSDSNTIVIPIKKQPRGARYQVRWYDTETGREIRSEATTATVRRRWFRKYLSFEFPESVRDLQNHTVNNTFGDAVFMISLSPAAH